MTNLERPGRGLFAVGLTFSIAVGCTAATTWRDDTRGQEIGPDKTPKKAGALFDPITACDEVVRAHNRIRILARLPALSKSSKLQASAERHAKDMAARDKMSHKGSDGSSPIDRIKATGYPYRRAGENIAAGRISTERLMKGWMDSPHHKRNILGSFSQIGVACATAESGKRYWCVTFGLPVRR
jgi:Cysteine-rich secretory protein family